MVPSLSAIKVSCGRRLTASVLESVTSAGAGFFRGTLAGSLSIAGMLGRAERMGNELFIGLSDNSVGALNVFRSIEAAAVGRHLATVVGPTQSSRKLKVTSGS